MSGSRTKTLRREFRARTGRTPVTHYEGEKRGIVQRVWDHVKRVRTAEVVTGRFITFAHNEFRHFKRAGLTGAEVENERISFLARRAELSALNRLNPSSCSLIGTTTGKDKRAGRFAARRTS